MGVSAQKGTECYTYEVSWSVPQPVCGVPFVIGNYSVRYQVMNGSSYTTVYSPSTSITLQGLMTNTNYSVSVAAISSNGNMSAFTGPILFVLQGKLSSCIQVLLGRQRRPYIVITFRYSYGFMFIMDYVYFGQFKMAALKV